MEVVYILYLIIAFTFGWVVGFYINLVMCHHKWEHFKTLRYENGEVNILICNKCGKIREIRTFEN